MSVLTKEMKKISDNRVRWGIIGAGNVCEVKSAPAMNIVPDSEIVAVMRRNGELAKDYAERHRIAKWYDQVEPLINDPEVNAVYIATPPDSHAELTIMAAKAGKPVYVEKPMARNHSETLTMIDACQEAGVPLYVAYYRRALPNFLKIRDLINDGAIGEVRFVQVQMFKPLLSEINSNQGRNWRLTPEISGGGHFFDLACHQLDFLDFLFGPVANVSSYAGNQAKISDAEDIVSGSFVFANGVIGSGIWCFSTGKVSERDFTTIVGSRGQIEYKTFGDPTVVLTTDSKGREEFLFKYPDHIQEPLIKLVVGDLMGTAICPSTGISGARTSWVMDKMVGRKL